MNKSKENQHENVSFHTILEKVCCMWSAAHYSTKISNWKSTRLICITCWNQDEIFKEVSYGFKDFKWNRNYTWFDDSKLLLFYYLDQEFDKSEIKSKLMLI